MSKLLAAPRKLNEVFEISYLKQHGSIEKQSQMEAGGEMRIYATESR